MGARGPFAGVVASGQIHTYVICGGGESQDFSRVNERKRGAPLCKWYMNMPESKTARQPPHCVTISTYRLIFIYLTQYTDTGVISDSRFIFLPASGPIVLLDSCAARCCDSELRLTVHNCAL